MNNEIDKLYSALTKKGYRADEIGDESAFRSAMGNKENRKELYDWISARGDFGIGDYATYETRLTGQDYATTPLKPIEEDVEESRKDAQRFSYVDKDLNEAYAERDKLKQMSYERRKQLQSPMSGFVGGMVPISMGAMSENSDEELKKIYAASNANNERIKQLEAIRDGKENNFFRAFGNTITSPSVLTMGISDLNDASAKMSLAKDIEEGKMTETDKALAYNLVQQQNTAARYEDDMGWVYRAGEITAHSIPFMVQIGATGGFTGLTKLGAEGATKGFIRKATGMIADDLIASAAVANTLGAGGTMSNIIDRKVGKIQRDGDDYSFVGGKDWAEAIYKGEVSSILEYYTEKLGGHLEGAGGKIVKGLDNLGLKKVSKALAAVGDSKIVKGFEKIGESVGYNGYLGEVMEEEANIVLNSIFVGDNKLGNLVDGRTQTDIWGGLLFSSGFMELTPRAIAGGLKGATYLKLNHDVNKSDRNAASLIGKDWDELRTKLEEASNDDIIDVLGAEVIINENLTMEQKAAASQYVGDLLKLRGFNTASMTAESNEVGDQASNAFQEGYNSANAKEIKDRLDEATARVREMYESEEGANEFLTRVRENPAASVELVMEEGGQERAQIVLDYINAQWAYDGMMQRVADNADMATAQSDAEVDKIAHKDGYIQSGVYDGRKVYVKGGNLDMAVVVDAQTGEVMTVATEKVTDLTEQVPAAREKEQRAAKIREQFAADLNAQTSNYSVNEEITLNVNGEAVPAMVTAITADGIEVHTDVPVNGANNNIFTAEELNGLVAKPITEQAPVAGNNMQQAEVEQPVEQAQPQTALEMIPRDDKNNPIYEQADAELAWDGVVEEADGNEEIAMVAVNSMIVDKQNALKKAEKAKAKAGETIAEKIAAENERIANIEKAKAELAKWEEIAGVKAKRAAAEEEKLRAEAESAQNVAETPVAENKMQEAEVETNEVQPLEAVGAEPVGETENLSSSEFPNSSTVAEGENTLLKEISNDERAEMEARIVNWLSEENLERAEGKTREEIFEEFGNELAPIAYIPTQHLSLVSSELKDQRIYCGKGYFIDHALRNHAKNGAQIKAEDVDVSKYLNIQSVLDNPDSIKETYIDGKRTIVFIKKIGRYFAELTQVEEDGKIVLHKSMFNQKKEPYAKLNDIRSKGTSSEGGVSSISHATEVAPAISLESRGDVVSNSTVSSVSEDRNIVSNEQEISQKSGENAENSGENVPNAVESAPSEETTNPYDVPKSEEEKEAIRQRANKWAKKVGVKVHIIESYDDVTNRRARKAILVERVSGWFSGGEVYIYMPHVENELDLDKTYIHEVVGHKGLKTLLGKDFDALCDAVWAMMSDAARAKYLDYIGAVDENGNLVENPSVEQMREAADEYMAAIAEDVNLDKGVLQRIIDWFRGWFNHNFADDAKSILDKETLTDEDIIDLVRLSYANLQQRAESKEQGGSGTMFSKKGENKKSPNSAAPGKPVNTTAKLDELFAKIDKLKQTYNSRTSKKTRGFITDIARELNLTKDGPSHYRTFPTALGDVTLRVSNHNSSLKEFELRNENEGVSIIISAKKNKKIDRTGSTGKSHVDEFFYPKQSLERSQGRPLVQILESIEEFITTGVYVDKTGIAQPEDSNGFRFKKDDATLIGTHSLTEEKLRKAIKMGGLANPSTAIFEMGEEMPGDYGEITFVMPSSMVDKKTGRNTGAFAGDAWTPTYPQVERQMGKKGAARAHEDVRSVPKEMQKEVKMGLDSWIDGRDGVGMAYLFLQEEGLAPELSRVAQKYSDEVRDRVSKIAQGEPFYRLSPEHKQKIVDLYIAQYYNGDRAYYEGYLKEKIDNLQAKIAEGNVPSLIKKRVLEDIAAINEYGYNYETVSDFLNKVQRDINHSGGVNDMATTQEAARIIRENGLEKEFQKWKEDLIDRYEIKEVIFKGFTPTGNRKYVPHTLENVSKDMKEQGRNGAVGLNATFNKFAAGLLKPLGSLDAIRKHKGNLKTTHAETEAFRDKWSEVYYNLAEKLQPNAKGYEDYGLDRVAEAAKKKDPKAFIKSEYGIELSEADEKALKDMVWAIQNEYPVMYFETKFERPVYLDEFAGVAVPENVGEDIVEALNNAGVKIETYEPGNEKARMDAVKRLSEEDGIRFRKVREELEFNDEENKSLTLKDKILQGMFEASAKNKEDFALRMSALNSFAKELARALKSVRLQRIVSAQKKYDRSTVDTLVKLAKMYFKNAQLLGEVSANDVSLVLGALNRAVGKDDISNEASRLVEILVDAHTRELKALLDKAEKVKASKINASGVEVQGTLDKYGQITINMYKEAASWEQKDLEQEIAKIENDIAESEGERQKELTAELEGLSLAFAYKSVVEAENDVKNLKREMRNGEAEMRANGADSKAVNEYKQATFDSIVEGKLDVAMAYQDLIRRFSQGVSKSSTRAKVFAQQQIDHVREIQRNANSDMEGISASAQGEKPKAWNNPIIRGMLSPMLTLQGFFKKFGEKAVDGKGYLYNRFMPMFTKANDQEYKGKVAARAKIAAKLQEIYGKQMSINNLLDEASKPGVTISYSEGGKILNAELTQGQMMYIYMVNKMADGEMKLRRMNITDDVVEGIKAKIDDRLVQLADWVQDELLSNLRVKYNAVYEKMFGAPMAQIEQYFPIKIRKEAIGEKTDVGQPDMESKPSTITGSIIKRTKNAAAVDLSADAAMVLLEHIDNMEHWAAFAEFNRDINTLLNYRHFQNQVKNMSTVRYGSGIDLWKNFSDAVLVAVGTYRTKEGALDKAVMNFAKGVTRSKIAFRLYTAIKQILSAPAFWSEAGFEKLIYSYTHPQETWEWAKKELPGFAERWEGRRAGSEKLLDRETDWKLWHSRFVENVSYYGMTPNAAVDAMTVALGSRAVYLTKYKIYKEAGYSEQRAKEKALQAAAESYNETQQSSLGAYMSPVQQSSSATAAIFTTFMNSNFAYNRKFAQAIANLTRRRKGDKSEMIEFRAKELVRDGLGAEEAKRLATKEYNKSILRDSANVALFGFGLQLLWEFGGMLIYLLGGDDDEEKKELLAEAMVRALASPINAMPLGQLATNAATAAILDDWKKMRIPQLVAVSDMQNIANLMEYDAVRGATELLNMFVAAGVGVDPKTFTDVYAAVADVEDLSPEELGLFALRIINAPQSQLEKLTVDKAIAESGKEMLDITRRYVEYRKKKMTPITQFLYTEEKEAKAEKRSVKRFNKMVEERMENLVEEDTAFKLYYNAAPDNVKGKLSKMREKYFAVKNGESKANFEKADAVDAAAEILFNGNPYNTIYFDNATPDDIDNQSIIKMERAKYKKYNDEFRKLKDVDKKVFIEKYRQELQRYKRLDEFWSAISKGMRNMEKNPSKAKEIMQSVRLVNANAIKYINSYE